MHKAEGAKLRAGNIGINDIPGFVSLMLKVQCAMG
jgi:hypothetical protein